MKKHIYLLAFISIFTIISNYASAQRCLYKQRGVELKFGSVDGKLDGKNLYTGIAVGTYNKRGSRWVYGGEYLQKGYEVNRNEIPLVQITGEGGYYHKLFSNPSKIFFLYLGASALVGYETINWNSGKLPDGSVMVSKDAVLFGAALTLELESYITDNVVFLINVRERLLGGSSVNKLRTQIGIGVKYIF